MAGDEASFESLKFFFGEKALLEQLSQDGK